VTSLASANARASAELLSYSWGSALGSVTTLCRLTFEPPSSVARLPQKFSAATTLRVVLDAGCRLEPPQAAASRTTRSAVPHLMCKTIAQVACASQVRVRSTPWGGP